MKKELPVCMDFEDDLMDDFGEFNDMDDDFPRPNRSRVTPIHCDNWTIVEAFNAINEELPKSQLGHGLLVRCAEAFDYLSGIFGFNPVQCVIIAMLVEKGQALSFRQMGKILGLSRLSMMTH